MVIHSHDCSLHTRVCPSLGEETSPQPLAGGLHSAEEPKPAGADSQQDTRGEGTKNAYEP